MLKIQKYKKMKNELNQQTKQILKKVSAYIVLNSNNLINEQCLNGQGSTQNSQKSSASLLQSQTTKHSATQQLVFNKQMEQSTKENSNQAANSMHTSASNNTNTTHNIKTSTLKFSINNLLNEITSRTGAIQGMYSSNNPSSSSVSANTSATNKQNQIAAKNHTSLM